MSKKVVFSAKKMSVLKVFLNYFCKFFSLKEIDYCFFNILINKILYFDLKGGFFWLIFLYRVSFRYYYFFFLCICNIYIWFYIYGFCGM